MRLLLDNNIHVDFARELPEFDVTHCRDLGWQKLLNGALVRAASERFDILLTIDKNMRYQTSLKGLSIAVVIFDAKNDRIEELKRFLPGFRLRIGEFSPGSFTALTVEN